VAPRNFLDDDFRYMEADSALLEPVFAAARRRSSGRGDAPGNAAPSGDDGADADADAEASVPLRDEPHAGASGASGRARPSARAGAGGGGGASTTFFAPSAAAAGREHVAVVQGASRGIGLEFVRQLLERTDLRSRSGARRCATRVPTPHSCALPRPASARVVTLPHATCVCCPSPRAGGRVVATCREPGTASELQELLTHYGPSRLTLLRLDVTDEASVTAAAKAVAARFGRCDLLLNVAGVLHIPGELQPGARGANARARVCCDRGLGPAAHVMVCVCAETSLAALTADAMMFAYRVNAVGAQAPRTQRTCTHISHTSHTHHHTCATGPMLVLQAFAPLLRETAASAVARGSGGGGGSGAAVGAGVAPTLVANISARVSSIRENRLGGWHAYRASKAALNMLTKTAAVELAKDGAPVTCLLLHPGTVATDLSRPFNRNGAHPARQHICLRVFVYVSVCALDG
jgi:NAD(P)-dependent dehydrogenase (short-subunit alcohol dehydrogenase family)